MVKQVEILAGLNGAGDGVADRERGLEAERGRGAKGAIDERDRQRIADIGADKGVAHEQGDQHLDGEEDQRHEGVRSI